jgi:hypothetical protein
MKDFYYILGTDVNCSSIEIKEAYRKLSKKFHPDLNQNDQYFENRFKELQEAYEVLNDPVKRKEYDAALIKFKKGKSVRTSSASESFKASPSAITKTRRGIDIAFTLILIGITCIFGDYVIKSINGTEKVKPQTAVIATATPGIPAVKIKHHRKIHLVSAQAIVSVPKVIVPVKPVKPVKVDTMKPQSRPAQIVRVDPKPIKIITVSNNSLYTTMVKANVTGIINMREQDNLSSDVLQKIPNYSQVDVLERGDRYYKIRYNNSTGFVPKWVLQTK